MNMNKEIKAISHDMGQLADDTRGFMAATADAAGEKVGEARQRFVAAVDRSREACGRVRQKVVEGAKAADVAVHEHPFQAIAISIGVGAILGYLLGRRRCGHTD
jgi:ElaB/YqjD/DUF883 family membrane-anchored ribosome-binding protein